MNVKEKSTSERFHLHHVLLALLACYALLLCLLTSPNATKAQVGQEERGLGVRLKDPARKVALVIGNADYDLSIGKLRNPTNDATDIAAALTRLGFKLVGGKPQLNLNKRQMIDLIREFANQIGKGVVGVFYFAGHGVQIDKRNYLIPITNSLQYQEDAEFEAVDVDQILRQMEYAGNALNIMILDACRNNELPKKTRNAGNGLGEPLRKPSGVFIAFAARDGQVASENPNGRNGLYTQELLRHLETPNLRLEDIFINTRREVKRLSNRTQEPIEYGSLDEIFYFKVNENTAAQPPSKPLPISTGTKSEKPLWHEIESQNTIAAYEVYLSTYPDGEFVQIAKTRLAKLKWSNFKGLARYLLKYDYVELFDDGVAIVKQNGAANSKYGLIDENGREIVPPKYDGIDEFKDGLANVRLETEPSSWKCGFIDKTGKEVVPLKYDWTSGFSEGLAEVKLNDKHGFIDKTGKVVIPLKYDGAGMFSEGLAEVELNGKHGFIDKTGKEVIPLVYNSVMSFYQGHTWAKIDDNLIVIDKTGEKVGSIKYRWTVASTTWVEVKMDDKYGLLDKSGKEIIPIKFDFIEGGFSEGLAGVMLNDKYGFAERGGQIVIPFKYGSVWGFSEGLAIVFLNGRYGLIDKAGKEVIPVKYDSYPWCMALKRNGFIGIVLNGKKGFADIYGNEYFDF